MQIIHIAAFMLCWFGLNIPRYANGNGAEVGKIIVGAGRVYASNRGPWGDGTLASSAGAIEYESTTDAALQVLVIDDNAARASIIEEGLREAGHRIVTLTDMRQLLAQIARIDPDVIFIDLENPNRDVLEQMFQVSRRVRRPVVMFVDHPTRPRSRRRSTPGSPLTSSTACARSA
jgi:CheY-like chemotaxis protein